MNEVMYLMGAGASFGKRTPKAERSEKGGDFIIEGLPLVNEIPDRLDYIIHLIQSIEISQHYNVFELSGERYVSLSVRNQLLGDLNWLKNESARHATIDTFAKKLYLTGQKDYFYKLEMLLTVFFIIEQVNNKPDGRYDTFLANVLNQDREIPDKIGILTWNYDSQFEIAFKEYLESSYHGLKSALYEYDAKGDFSPTTLSWTPKIFKINGTANFKECVDFTSHRHLDIYLLIEILKKYVQFDNKRSKQIFTNLSFAWDCPYFDNERWNIIKKMLVNTKTLIVIGYTFPFFNREIDRALFKTMPNLTQIYIQDPNANNILRNIDPVLSLHNRANVGENIEPITNVDQFFLPPEL